MKFLLQTLLFLVSLHSFAQVSTEEIYEKKEVYIPMRDGTKLYTAIYTPKDISKDKKYPMLMQRTCYSIAPYGEENFKRSLGPNSINSSPFVLSLLKYERFILRSNNIQVV